MIPHFSSPSLFRCPLAAGIPRRLSLPSRKDADLMVRSAVGNHKSASQLSGFSTTRRRRAPSRLNGIGKMPLAPVTSLTRPRWGVVKGDWGQLAPPFARRDRLLWSVLVVGKPALVFGGGEAWPVREAGWPLLTRESAAGAVGRIEGAARRRGYTMCCGRGEKMHVTNPL
jgi:hypothetical protein